MTAFFILNDQSIAVGPFSGVELRESAMAGIIGPDAAISGSAEGPWILGRDAGLFEGKVPLPHPDGTEVPAFHVRGMVGAVGGPFKLRALIGFASRGMLPANATVRRDDSPDWVCVSRINILQACLAGHLVLLGASGNVVLRAHHAPNGDSPPDPELESARPPVELAQPVDPADSTAYAIDSEPDTAAESAQNDNVASGETAEDFVESQPSWWEQLKEIEVPGVAALSEITIPRRLILYTLGLLLIVAGIGTAYSQWRKSGMDPDQVVGDWISEDGTFAVGFRDDGSFIVFNTEGKSWSGDYVWSPRSDDQEGFESIEPFSSQVDEIDPGHQKGAVKPTDGHIRLRGFDQPQIDSHQMSDCFLRINKDKLLLGYLTNVHWTRQNKSMEAGWMSLNRTQRTSVDPMNDMTTMETEPPPTVGFAVERSPHISEAIGSLQTIYESGEEFDSTPGSLCYAVRVNAQYLLQNYGIPDEARALFPFERSMLPDTADFSESQLVRYGSLKLILSGEGTIQYVELMVR